MYQYIYSFYKTNAKLVLFGRLPKEMRIINGHFCKI